MYSLANPSLELEPLAALTPQLTEFAFVGCRGPYVNQADFLDEVVATLGPDDWLTARASKLGSLANLAELEVVEVLDGCAVRLVAVEVVAMIERSTSLQKVTLCPAACSQWHMDERR